MPGVPSRGDIAGGGGVKISFFVVGKPATQGSKRAFMAGGRPIIVEDCKRNKPWRTDVRAACAEVIARDGWQQPAIHAGPVRVSMWFVLARPKNHYGSGRNAEKLTGQAKSHPTGKPDVVKLARAVEDSLKGLAWTDDSQIVDETIRKQYAMRDEPEGVRVEIEAI